MAEPILQVSNLSRKFGALQACNDVSLEVRTGEIHGLIGPNGAGKSTLLKLLAGELKPDSGSITLSGETIDALSEVQRSKAGLARTFQVSSIVPEFSARQNLTLAAVGEAGHPFRFFANVSKDVRLAKRVDALLSQYDLNGRADIPVSELSHGERRQLEVALALALEPSVLLMDEPMAGMGPDGSKRLTAKLKEVKHQVPILLVEHDMDAVFALADRLSVLVYGEIIASGSVAEIRASKAVREAYLGDIVE